MTTGAQQQPIELTRDLLDVSVTERMAFRTCRRRWWFETIENLVPLRERKWAQPFGTGMHRALECYYGGGDDPFEAFRSWHDETMSAAERDGAQDAELDDLFEHRALGEGMLENYFVFDTQSRVQLGNVIAVEGISVADESFEFHSHPPKGYMEDAAVARHESGRLLVPIVNPRTKKPLHVDGQVPHLSARIDLLTERRTPQKGLWVVDHKTATKAPNDRGLDFDDQLTGYCYVVWRWLGAIPRGAIYNVLIKQLPKEPRLVRRRGSRDPDDLVLSSAKDQLTTPKLYLAALKNHGLIVPGTNRPVTTQYEECLDSLLAHGWDRFFVRFEALRNEHELQSFERRLWSEWHDMFDAKENERERYPNQSTWWCPNCSVKQICQAIEEGSDADYIIEHQFMEGEDRKAAA